MIASFDLKSFKHDGSSHRMWRSLTLVNEDDNYWILASPRTKVIEDDGREWKTQQPTLYILSKKEFFNVICMIKGKRTIDYYVNIASPTVLISENVLGFIDYDLDLKKSRGEVKELDINEYQANSIKYSYPEDLKKVVEETFRRLKISLTVSNKPFDDFGNLKTYESFQNANKIRV
ncbi:MAG TPA: hypothetical protein DCX39_02495 [Firmicutes bacterium]|jgi:protein associated with RNAse G/E|nr:hypothetical protein [Bacillota bacterium]HAX00015.1 hypothetical protein [Bacillota bacterium]